MPQDEPKAGTTPNEAGAENDNSGNATNMNSTNVDDELQAAMDDAAASVEPDAAPTSAGEVVTEAIIKARHELEQVLEQTRKEVENFREKWLRAAADLENYRKRAAREREETVRFGSEKLLRDFLPLLDDLERAIDMSTQEGENATLMDGVRLVHKKFISQLEKHGVATFESVGEGFDPTRHEAVQQMHSDQPQGTVVTQLQRGFLLHERLLRPAMVIVSLGPKAEPDQGVN